MDLGGGGVLAAQLGEFGGQLLEPIVEALILAFEEHRDLTKHVSIVDLFDTQHTRTTSRMCVRAKSILRRARGGQYKRRGREWHTADERAAFEKQLQFAHGEPQRRRCRRVAPQTREAPLFKPLGVDAEPGAVPQQDLRPFPRAIGEHEEIARQRIAPEVIQHERIEAVEPFAHVHGSAVSVDGDLACGADHARSRSTVTSPARSSPSMRKPCGVTTTGFLVDVIVVTVAGATAT